MRLPPEQVRKQFQDRGLKFTGQRYAIYRALASSTEHPSVEDLYSAVKKAYPTLSMNTVYNTLESLQAIGIASEISLWHDKARFDANQAPHHHLVCLDCKKIEDLYDDTLDRLALSPKAKQRYQIIGHRIEFHGYCSDCKNKVGSSHLRHPRGSTQRATRARGGGSTRLRRWRGRRKPL